MNRKFLFVLSAGLIGALSLIAVGCDEMCCNSSQGSGSILIKDTESDTSHKATFSFRVECIGTNDPAAPRKVTGRFEYQDHKPWKKSGASKADSVSIRGTVGDVANTGFLNEPELGLLDPATGYPKDESYWFSALDDKVCAQNANIAIFTGTYTPQPNPLGEDGKGTFTVAVKDNGTSGPSPDDVFVIKLTGGAFKGYLQMGTLAGGNMKAL